MKENPRVVFNGHTSEMLSNQCPSRNVSGHYFGTFFKDIPQLIPEARAYQTRSHIHLWKGVTDNQSFVSNPNAEHRLRGKRWQVPLPRQDSNRPHLPQGRAVTGPTRLSGKRKKHLQESVNILGGGVRLWPPTLPLQKIAKVARKLSCIRPSRTSWTLRDRHSTSHKSAPRWKTRPSHGLLSPSTSPSLTGSKPNPRLARLKTPRCCTIFTSPAAA
ncbi:hypothetical protein GWK47_006090 [Chionoecetes opilio]|uniref:Uncharacterized protein n=1 Tax=Chionoecetes opilio TaxID=41210 RepID=A0A8J4Y6E9_CHIOP|nr:hypothetical protein GWK47_006090 [Chionoecetes opilio]